LVQREFLFLLLREWKRVLAKKRKRPLWPVDNLGDNLLAPLAPIGGLPSVTFQELLIARFAQTDALAKLLIEKEIIASEEYIAGLSRRTSGVSKAAQSGLLSK
jgi:hypothetical protein